MSKKQSVLCFVRGFIVLALLGSVCVATPARAADAAVDTLADENDGECVLDCTLREAIAQAVDGDEITFTPGLAGTILLNSELMILQDITIDGAGASITISGQNAQRVFWVLEGSTAALSNLTIIHGLAVSAPGGAIYNQGTLTVTHCTVSNSSAYFGGGINNNLGTMIIENTVISGNSANTGGGIYNNGTLTVSNTTLSGNAASTTGAGIHTTSSLTLNSSTLLGNTASGNGGGIFVSGNATINNTTLSGNTGAAGGGIINNGTLTLNNSTLAENSASYNGSGIYNAGALNLANTILAYSILGADCFNEGGTIPTNTHNWIENTPGGYGSCGTANGPDPLLNDLGNNGGATQTYALLNNSPAIDHGDPATCLAIGHVDQRGQQRDDLQCDIGAFELKLTDSPTVTLPVNATGIYTFGPTRARVEITTLGCLESLTIGRWNANHPQAGSPNLQTGIYWSIEPSCASGFEATLSLPAENFVAATYSKLCRWNGSAWDCGQDADNTFSNLTMADGTVQDYIHRQPVTAFSDWVAGYYLSPTSIRLSSLTARPSISWATPVTTLALLAGLVVALRRRK